MPILGSGCHEHILYAVNFYILISFFVLYVICENEFTLL